jgi:hypothetical protein
MITLGKQSPLTFHAGESRHELDFGPGESVTSMKSTVHIWVCHSREEFGRLGLTGCRGILLEEFGMVPFLLVPQLVGDQRVTLFGLVERRAR